MTFLNYIMLFGLIAVAIPILIHLLNRRRARVVEWGAMRFLLASLASRNRRILIEELVLMALRCLTIALLVVAMARPFLPTRTGVSWVVVLPAVLIAAVLIGIATSAWSHRLARWALLSVAGLLVTGAAIAVAVEHFRQEKQWSGRGGGEKDIAIVIDGSMSMNLSAGEHTNFERALEEARAVIHACGPADAVSILLAGPVASPIVPAPISDRKELLAKLAPLKPTHGSMQVLSGLNAAVTSLSKGHNAGKRIVLITDGQNVGWDLDGERRWEFAAANLASLDPGATSRTAPNGLPAAQLICRKLPLPETFRNVCVSDVSLSRKIVGTDREVKIDVKLTNTGTAPITPTRVELLIDGLEVARQNAEEIASNASETLRFSHRFETHGPKVITVRAVCEDDLAADNAADRVLHVTEELPVLLVEGAPSSRRGDGAAAFLNMALAPGYDTSPARKQPERTLPSPPDERRRRYLVVPQVVVPAELANIEDLSKYRVVILANVPMVPQRFGERLGRFVRGGGGLLIVTGDRTEPRSYNLWTARAGERIVPAKLERRVSAGGRPVKLALKTFSHPALDKVADVGQSDADQALVTTYWILQIDEKDTAVRIGGLFDSGHPFLVERKLGKGFVLMTSISMDKQDSSLPGLNCFLPLVHELVCYLAEPLAAPDNVKPGTEITLPIPDLPGLAGQIAPGDPIDVVAPTGEQRSGVVLTREGRLQVRFVETEHPGLYRAVLPHREKDRKGKRLPLPPELPFVVLGDPAESCLDVLGPGDFEKVGGHVQLLHAHSTDELTAFIAGGVPGRELWRYLVICALLGVIGEIALTRWIAMRRRAHAVETVSFGSEGADAQSFRTRAQELLAVPAEKARGDKMEMVSGS